MPTVGLGQISGVFKKDVSTYLFTHLPTIRLSENPAAKCKLN